MKTYQVPQYGDISQMQWNEHPIPEPGAHEIVVKVAASGVNPVDIMIAHGDFKLLFPQKTPFTLGNEFAGTVSAVGSDVTRFSVGDEVFARPSEKYMGTFTEFAVAHEDDVALKPANLTMVEAASIPLVMLTALQAFTEKTKVGPRSKVFIQGGTGGLGSIAIQVAKHLGAFVATTVSTPNVELAKELGADVVVDYRTENYELALSEYDVVLDTLGGDETLRAMKVLAPGGTLVSVVGPPDTSLAEAAGKPWLKPLMFAMSRKPRAAAKKLNVQYKFLLMHADGAKLEEYRPVLESGEIRPVVGSVFAFEDTDQALELAEAGKIKGQPKPKPGKIVVEM